MIQTVQAEFPQGSLRYLCALFGVRRSWRSARAKLEADSDEPAVLAAIDAIVLAPPGDGDRRVTQHLPRAGRTINRTRGLRLLREASVLCQLRRSVQTTPSRHPVRR